MKLSKLERLLLNYIKGRNGMFLTVDYTGIGSGNLIIRLWGNGICLNTQGFNRISSMSSCNTLIEIQKKYNITPEFTLGSSIGLGRCFVDFGLITDVELKDENPSSLEEVRELLVEGCSKMTESLLRSRNNKKSKSDGSCIINKNLTMLNLIITGNKNRNLSSLQEAIVLLNLQYLNTLFIDDGMKFKLRKKLINSFYVASFKFLLLKDFPKLNG